MKTNSMTTDLRPHVSEVLHLVWLWMIGMWLLGITFSAPGC